MRCFIAIEIDDHIRADLGRFVGEVKRSTRLDRRDIKWVDPENIHLTLRFLGEVDDRTVVDICRVTKEVCRRSRPFSVELTGPGTFGRPARVLWIGIQVSGELARLVEKLENGLMELGFEAEKRKFAGHLTLGRIKSRKGGHAIEKYLSEAGPGCSGEQEVDGICVYKSDLTNTGPVYTLLAKCKFG